MQQKMPINAHVRAHYNQHMQTCSQVHRDSLMKYNNLVKKKIITDATKRNTRGEVYETKKRRRNKDKVVECSILDVGCGRGGDLFKWAHCNISNYVGVDISDASIEEAKNRSKKISDVEFDFHIMPIEKFFKSLDKNTKYNIISLQFVLHYIIDSMDSLEQLIDCCRQHLNTDGVIIGTIVNSQEACKYLSKESKENNHQRYFNLRPLPFQDKKNVELGFMYEFFLHNCVNNCIEFIVPWNDIEVTTAKYGMQIDYVTSFVDLSLIHI